MTTTLTRPPSTTDTGRCGEYAGYRRHIRRGEKPCQSCRIAQNAWLTNFRARRRRARITGTDRRMAAKAPRLTSGRLAGTEAPHQFVPLDQSQCRLCWGWRDDPRHPLTGGPVVGR